MTTTKNSKIVIGIVFPYTYGYSFDTYNEYGYDKA